MNMTANLAKVFNDINKKIGPNTIIKGSDITQHGQRITTGSVSLDVALGGGWPANQWQEVIGDPSNGKTALALKTIAANQKRDPNFTAVWVAAEEWVPSYAEMCGVDQERLYVVTTNIMEEAFDAVIRLTESKEIDCIVIDSLPALIPSSEDDKQMDEATVGRGALLTNKFFRKITKASKRSLVEPERPFVGIMINQWRSKIGVMYGDPRTTPGGMGKDFSYFTRIVVKRDEWIEAGEGQEKRRVGQTIKFQVIKNKSAAPSATASVDFYFGEGGELPAGEFDFAKEMLAIGILNKVITRAGAYYRYADRQWQGSDAMLDSIREEIELKEALERDVLDSIKALSKHVNEE